MTLWAIINQIRIPIDLEGDPIVGGEGEVYFINTPPYQDYCAKIYLPNNNIEQIEDKLRYMIGHIPVIKSENIRICWPEFLLYDADDKFRGFLMKKAYDGSRDIDILQDNGNMGPLEDEYPKWSEWAIFDLKRKTGNENRLFLLLKLAEAINAIHSIEGTVIHDLKPSNVLATVDKKISIVDVDSFQITENIGRVHRSFAFTPDYYPKKSYKISAKGDVPNISTDCFAYAVIAYNTMFGVHPYSGFIRRKPFDNDKYASLAECIKNDISPYSANKDYISFLAPEYNFHKSFEKIDKRLQDLFKRSFNDSFEMPMMKDWISAFNSVLGLEEEDVFEGALDKSIETEIIAQPKTRISWGTIGLLALQVAIISYIIGNHIVDLNLVTSIFLGFFLIATISIIRGLAIIYKSENTAITKAPTLDGLSLSSISQEIVDSLKATANKNEIQAITTVLYDYLMGLTKAQSLDLTRYIPATSQISKYPIESITLMLSSEEYLVQSKCEDRYYNFHSIIKEIHNNIQGAYDGMA